MSELAAWGTLILCLALAALRVPSALRGQGRPALLAFLLMSAVIALALPSIYLPIDGTLGGANLTNLLSHLILNVLFIVIGVTVAKALSSKRAHKVILGVRGTSIFAACTVAIIVTFVLSSVPDPSMGLNGYADRPWVEIYRIVSRLYPAFVAAVLVPASIRALNRNAGRPLLLLAASCFGLGFCLVVILPAIHILGVWTYVAPAVDATVYTALVLVALGTTLAWTSNRIRIRRERGLIARSVAS